MGDRNSSDSTYISLPTAWYQCNGYVLCTVSLLACLENSLVFLTFIKNKSLRSPSNVFIVSIAFGDFLMACIIPLSASSNISGEWIHGKDWCTAEAFVVFFVGMSEIYSIAATAVHRYIIITKFTASTLVNMRTTIVALSGCWLAGFIWALIPLFITNGYGLEGAGVSCGLDWTQNDVGHQIYIGILFVLGFLFPSGVIVFSYTSIYRRIAQAGSGWTAGERCKRLMERNMRVARTTIFLTCGFFVAWTPYAVVSFWRAYGNPDDIPLWLVSSPALFAKCACVWNPVIYVCTNKQFREAFASILPCARLRAAPKSFRKPQSESAQTPNTVQLMLIKKVHRKIGQLGTKLPASNVKEIGSSEKTKQPGTPTPSSNEGVDNPELQHHHQMKE